MSFSEIPSSAFRTSFFGEEFGGALDSPGARFEPGNDQHAFVIHYGRASRGHGLRETGILGGSPAKGGKGRE